MPQQWPLTLFPEQSAGPVDLPGHRIWLAYWLAVELGDRVHVHFEEPRAAYPQGLRLAFDRYFHGLQIGPMESNKGYLWAGEGPRHREVEIVRVHGPATLSVTNCWREPGQRRPSFATGPAWMEHHPQLDGTMILLASDGTTPVGVPTLTVRLAHERNQRLVRAT